MHEALEQERVTPAHALLHPSPTPPWAGTMVCHTDLWSGTQLAGGWTAALLTRTSIRPNLAECRSVLWVRARARRHETGERLGHTNLSITVCTRSLHSGSLDTSTFMKLTRFPALSVPHCAVAEGARLLCEREH